MISKIAFLLAITFIIQVSLATVINDANQILQNTDEQIDRKIAELKNKIPTDKSITDILNTIDISKLEDKITDIKGTVDDTKITNCLTSKEDALKKIPTEVNKCKTTATASRDEINKKVTEFETDKAVKINATETKISQCETDFETNLIQLAQCLKQSLEELKTNADALTAKIKTETTKAETVLQTLNICKSEVEVVGNKIVTDFHKCFATQQVPEIQSDLPDTIADITTDVTAIKSKPNELTVNVNAEITIDTDDEKTKLENAIIALTNKITAPCGNLTEETKCKDDTNNNKLPAFISNIESSLNNCRKTADGIIKTVEGKVNEIKENDLGNIINEIPKCISSNANIIEQLTCLQGLRKQAETFNDQIDEINIEANKITPELTNIRSCVGTVKTIIEKNTIVADLQTCLVANGQCTITP